MMETFAISWKSPLRDSWRVFTCAANRLATHLLSPEELSEEELREHPVFADLNLYPSDIDQLLAGKDKALAIVNAMNL